MKSAVTTAILEDLSIRLISAPCFLATKIEAFQSGTRGDFLTSRDLDDSVTILDGRQEIIEETQTVDSTMRTFLAETFQEYLQNETFLEALEGLLYPGTASQARRSLILSRMAQIAEMSKQKT